MKPKKASKQPTTIVKQKKQEPSIQKLKINNPWTQQPIKVDSSFGLLNSIIQKHYGQQPKYKSKTLYQQKQVLQTSQSLINDIKQISNYQSEQNKQLVYDKYRSQFDIISKLVIMNNTIAFINSAKDILKEKSQTQYSNSYLKVPCQSQATFLKLYHRITRPESIQFNTSLTKKQIEELQDIKAQIISKLYIE